MLENQQRPILGKHVEVLKILHMKNITVYASNRAHNFVQNY